MAAGGRDRSRSRSPRDDKRWVEWISRQICLFGRYPNKRPKEIQVDNEGGMLLDDLCKHWGSQHKLQSGDILKAITENMVKHDGKLRFSIYTSRDERTVIRAFSKVRGDLAQNRGQSWNQSETRTDSKDESWRQSASSGSTDDRARRDNHSKPKVEQSWKEAGQQSWSQTSEKREQVGRARLAPSWQSKLAETWDRAPRWQSKAWDKAKDHPKDKAMNSDWKTQARSADVKIGSIRETNDRRPASPEAANSGEHAPPMPPGAHWKKYTDDGAMWWHYDGPLGQWWYQEDGTMEVPEPYDDED